MPDKRLAFEDFVRLVLDALEEAELEYLIGGAVAVWAWGEARTTQGLDLVISLPGERIVQLSDVLAKRNMLVPPDIIFDLLIQPEGDLPINAIHMDTGYKAELFAGWRYLSGNGLREADAGRSWPAIGQCLCPCA